MIKQQKNLYYLIQKKFDIKLKKVDIRTKEGHLPTTFEVKNPGNTLVPVPALADDVKTQNLSDKKESPPTTSRRSRRSNPKPDDSLEVEKPSDSNLQNDSLEENKDDSTNHLNGTLEGKPEPVRRGRKRNLSATDP